MQENIIIFVYISVGICILSFFTIITSLLILLAVSIKERIYKKREKPIILSDLTGKNILYTFKGIPYKEEDYICFDVSKKIYTKIMNKIPGDDDKSYSNRKLYRLYLNDFCDSIKPHDIQIRISDVSNQGVAKIEINCPNARNKNRKVIDFQRYKEVRRI